MPQASLTQKEKNAFYGLVKFPNLNDRALAEVLDEKMSTVTSIRRRLRERDYYTKVRIPNFKSLDCEILCLVQGSFKPVAPHGTEALIKMEEGAPATFFGISNPYHFLMLGVSRSYTEARCTYDGYYRDAKFLKAIDENDLSFSYLPFSMTNVLNFFDYGPLLKNIFGVSKELKGDEGTMTEPVELDLTPTEKKVFLGLVKYPELADKTLAERIKVSRQATSKMRKRFENEGHIRTAIIPNLAVLGLGMLIFTHYTINPKRAGPFDEKSILGKDGLPSYFAVSTPYEMFSLSAFATYQEYERVSERYFKLYSESKVLLKKPTMIPFSMEDVVYFKNHVYSNILSRLFED